jgi:4-amino-4-deoxy-L-arabinose transferase-like glycosyltransferase
LAGIVLVALATRLVGIAYDYPFFLDGDEAETIHATVQMMANHSLDPHFYFYGPLLIYIEALWLLPYLAVRGLLGHPGVPTVTLHGTTWATTTADPAMHVYGRLPFVGLGVATVVLAFFAARRLAGPRAGLLAAALLALSPLLANQSHSVLPNAPTSFFTLLTLWFTLRYLDEPEGQRQGVVQGRRSWLDQALGGESRNLVLAVVAASLDTAIKYNAVVVLLIPLLAVYWGPPAGSESRLRRCVRLCIVAAVVGLAVTPPAIFNTFAFVHGAGYIIRHYAVAHGGSSTAGGPSIVWNGRYLIDHEGLLVFPTAVIGMAVIAWLSRRRAALLLLTVMAAYYLVLGVQRVHFDRNLLVLVPLLSVSCAYALVELATVWRPVGVTASILLATVMLASLGRGSLDQVRMYLTTPAPLVVRSWLQVHLPSGAHLVADGYTVPPLDRRDMTLTYIDDVRLTPGQLWQMGDRFAVIGKNLSYYEDAPQHLSSRGVAMRPRYSLGGIVVFEVVQRPRR